MKNKIEVEKTIIITKENFKQSLKEFKENIKSKLLDYIIINNDISTSNPKVQAKEGEIVFSEFTFCKYVNYPGKDINYTFTTFLVPSIKFHRYTNDEIASFNSIFLKYLTNEKSVYDFNLINDSNSLSYDNIHRRGEFESSLNLILKDGKPFKKENKTSYYYYPKAFELPSIKYQKTFENFLYYFVNQNFDENAKKNESEDKSTYSYESDKYTSDFKFLNAFLDFKWWQFYEKMESDSYKIYVNEFKIKFVTEKIEFNQKFTDFIEKIKKFLESEQTIENFELEINPNEDKELNEDFFKNWKQYIMSEDSIAEFSYKFSENKENIMEFTIKAEKSKDKKDNKSQSLYKFISALISIPNEIQNKKEFEIENIFFRRINMKQLFPEKLRNSIEFYYHLTTKIDSEKFKLEKQKDYYLSKISYKKIFVSNKNEEEILFGYKFDLYLRQFFEIKEKDMERAKQDLENEKERVKTISLEFAQDLEILLKDEEFKSTLNGYYKDFKFVEETEKNTKFKSGKYKLVAIPNFKEKQFKKDFDLLLKKAKEIKKNDLLDEEIGVTYFYDAIFKKENINIYGTNLKNKLYFVIKQLLLEPNKNSEEEIQKLLNKVNVYDISYICLKKNIDFFKKYLKLKKDEEYKERTMTQRLGYVIQETEDLKNIENLAEFKNKFYLDEKDKISKKHYITVKKKDFYEKGDNIVNAFKDKTDFTINKNPNDNDVFELTIIDPGKYGEIENIAKIVESC